MEGGYKNVFLVNKENGDITFDHFSDHQLNAELEKAVEAEDYIYAAALKKEIDKRAAPGYKRPEPFTAFIPRDVHLPVGPEGRNSFEWDAEIHEITFANLADPVPLRTWSVFNATLKEFEQIWLYVEESIVLQMGDYTVDWGKDMVTYKLFYVDNEHGQRCIDAFRDRFYGPNSPK